VEFNFPRKLSYAWKKVHHKPLLILRAVEEKNLELSATLLYI